MKIHPSRINDEPHDRFFDVLVVAIWIFLVTCLVRTQAGQNVQYDTVNGVAITGGADTIIFTKGGTAFTINATGTAALTASPVFTTPTLGDDVVIGIPNASMVASAVFTAWVSATNTVTIRYHNSELVTTRDPASGTWRASVWQH